MRNFYINDSPEAVPIDVPDEIADNVEARNTWVKENYSLPDTSLTIERYSTEEEGVKEEEELTPLDFIADPIERGLYQAGKTWNIFQEQIGWDTPEEAAKDIQDYESYISKIQTDRPTLDALVAMSEVDASWKGVGDFWDIASTPVGLKAIGVVALESLGQFAPALAASIGVGVAGAGSLAVAAVAGLGSLAVEYGASTLGAMSEFLGKDQKSLSDDKAVAELLKNDIKMAEFKEFALKRGIPIAVIDGLSFGIAGKISGALRNSRRKAEKAATITKTKTPTTETITEIGPKVPSRLRERGAFVGEALALQPGLGATGEALAQLASGEEFKLGDVILEGVAEGPTGAIETVVGTYLNERKNTQVEQKLEEQRIITEKKAEELRQLPAKEEIAMVKADLQEGSPDVEQYERTAFFTLDKPIKAGEKSINKDSIKGWFNGEIKQPRSKKLIMEYFERKGYVEKVKGQYVWTEAAAQRAKEIEAGGVQTELFTEEEVTATEPIPRLRDIAAEIEQARPVVEEEVAVSEEVTEPFKEIDLTQDTVLDETIPATIEDIDITELPTEVQPTSPEETGVVEARDEVEINVDTPFKEIDVTEDTVIDETIPPTFEAPEITEALPIEDPVQIVEPIQLDLPNIPNKTREYINESISPKVRKDIQPFKLRREGEDRDAIRNELQANLDTLRTAQIISATETKESLSLSEEEYLQKAFQDEQELLDKLLNNSIVTTTDEQRDKQKEENRKFIDNLSMEDIAGAGAWHPAYWLWHPTRLAEKFRGFRNVFRPLLARREAREKYNNIGMSIAEPIYRNTEPKVIKRIGKVAVLLDAFYSARKDMSILTRDENFFEDANGIRITLPAKPPTKEVKKKDTKTKEETVTQEPVMEQRRYDALLNEFGVKAGDTISLNAVEADKYKTSQKAFKKMFDINTVSFLNYMLQHTPLHKGIERRYDDTVDTLKEKIVRSVREYIDDLNKILPEDQRISEEVKKQLPNARPDSGIFKDLETQITLANVKLPKKDQNAEGILKSILNQAQMIVNINNQQKILKDHPFYLPRLRYGEFSFTVIDRDTKKVVGYYTNTPIVTKISDKAKRKSLEKTKEKIKKIYPESEYKYSPITKRDLDTSKQGLDQPTLDRIRKFGQSMGYPTYNRKEPVGRFLEDVQNKLKEIGFGKFLAHRDQEVISGYYTPDNQDTYLPIVLSNYIRSAADTASNLDYVRPITEGIRILRTGIKDPDNPEVDAVEKQPYLAEYAESLIEYINKPNEPGAIFKSFAFHYALGMNFSSAIVNLSQPFVATIPLLGMITKRGSATVEVMRGLKDAGKLFKASTDRLGTYGFDFTDPKAPDYLTQDEWNMLRKMYREGTIQAIVNLDLGAKIQQDLGSTLSTLNVSNKMASGMSKGLEFSAFMFGAVEQTNRIATALAAYRMAVKSNANLKRFQKFGESTYFDDKKMTPEQAARMMVYKTQFLIGKENRPRLFRNGVMNVGTQFLSFIQQYIGMYSQALNLWFGKAGKADAELKRMGSIMLGSMVLSMMFFGGFMGLPYMENLRQFLRRTRALGLSKYEFDLEYGMKEAMNSVMNPYLTDVVMRGAFSRLTGIDFSRRVGVGEPIPFNLMQGNLMAATGPAGSLVWDAGARMLQASKLDDTAMMLTSVMPLGPRAFVEGVRGIIKEDTPIRTTQGKVLMPGKEVDKGTTIPWNRLKQMGGFTPQQVAEERARKQIANFVKTKARPLQDRYLTLLTEKMAAQRAAKTGKLRRQFAQDIQELRNEIRTINRQAIKEGRRDELINITGRAIRDRMRIRERGQLEGLTKKAAKQFGGKRKAEEMLHQLKPSGTAVDLISNLLKN